MLVVILKFTNSVFVCAILSISFFFVLSCPKIVNAVETIYFEDNFNENEIDTSKWTASNTGGTYILDGGFLKLSSINSRNYPYIRSSVNPFPLTGPYVLEIKFSFPLTTGAGVGIYVGNLLPPDSAQQSYIDQNDSQIALFDIWQGLNDSFLVQARHCFDLTDCDLNRTTISSKPVNSDFHIIKIRYEGNDFTIDLDGDRISSPILENSERRPSDIIIGNPVRTINLIDWTNIWIDYVRVSTIDAATPTPTETPSPTPTPTPSPTPTPTPEPTPTPLPPLVVIPGLGGSWDVAAILGSTPGNNWRVPNFVTVYNNLLASLTSAGYELNNNLFVFAYDWRKSLNGLGVDLNAYVRSLIASGKLTLLDKVTLIGHSYGGLVARAYGQSLGLLRTGKIITLGSPHLGVLDAYAAWEGATTWSKAWWQKAALELTMQFNQGMGENRVNTLRRLAPGIRDLLPLNGYLKTDGVVKPEAGMNQRNLILRLMNNDMGSVDAILWSNAGLGQQTKQFLKVTGRDWLDRLNNRWEDGKPVASNPLEYGEGDGTVLLSSAKDGWSQTTETAANHGEIVTGRPALEKVFEQLELEKAKIKTETADDVRESVLMMVLRSPGYLQVCRASVCDEALGGFYLDGDKKQFLLPSDDEENLIVGVIEDGLGIYHLDIGLANNEGAVWQEFAGELNQTGQRDNYEIYNGEGDLQVRQDERGAGRSLIVLGGQLFELEHSREVKRLINKAIDRRRNYKARLTAIQELREELAELLIKAFKQNKGEKVELILDIWGASDNLAESLLNGRNNFKNSKVENQYRNLEDEAEMVEQRLVNSTSYYAGKVYEMFRERRGWAKEEMGIQNDLAVDRIQSARLLLGVTMKIK